MINDGTYLSIKAVERMLMKTCTERHLSRKEMLNDLPSFSITADNFQCITSRKISVAGVNSNVLHGTQRFITAHKIPSPPNGSLIRNIKEQQSYRLIQHVRINELLIQCVLQNCSNNSISEITMPNVDSQIYHH